eukprot:TRINITY_DN4804_c0_g1_i10.p1 TRINITY_DN4804_c0_g1~~TRINITY_DN4804_c0_g1_i10.p1  ORF type:complete len:122 (-),score=6.64 TRINITY_DN4804_c0_g1_i10:61-426(-)
MHIVSPGHHKGNGLCERAIKTFKNKMIKIWLGKNLYFDTALFKTCKAYNRSFNKVMEMTPLKKLRRTNAMDDRIRMYIKKHSEVIFTENYGGLYKINDMVAIRNFKNVKDTAWLSGTYCWT